MGFRLRTAVAAAALTTGLVAGITPAAVAAISIPAVPASTMAKDPGSDLDSLTVRAHGSGTGYSRDKFGIWQMVSGQCNTREEVLKRDGKNVEVDAKCAPTSGSWTSPYDGATWTKAADVDIDHMVPLKNAWVSGASKWSQDQRVKFGNDRQSKQLLAVTDNVNQSKSDKGPEDWKPPLTSYYCTYATSWISVKKLYALSVTSQEKAALKSMLGSC